MRTSAKVIAMDLGASGGKCFAGVFDAKGFTLSEIHRFSHEPATLHIADRTGRVEERSYWDDLLIYRNMVEGLHAYRREIGSAADSVGIDTWGADGVFVTQDGVLLGPMYCYRDHRLDGMIEQVKSKMDPARLYEITGIHFQPFNVSNQLLWFMTNRGDLVRRGVRFFRRPRSSATTWAGSPRWTPPGRASPSSWTHEGRNGAGRSCARSPFRAGSCRASWRRARSSGSSGPGSPSPLA